MAFGLDSLGILLPNTLFEVEGDVEHIRLPGSPLAWGHGREVLFDAAVVVAMFVGLNAWSNIIWYREKDAASDSDDYNIEPFSCSELRELHVSLDAPAG